MTDTVVFTFARMNPPTKGHELLISKILSVAQSCKADHCVFLSQTQHYITDPLDWKFKLQACQTSFHNVQFSTDIAIKTPFQALELLAKEYKTVYFVVGGDRLVEFNVRMAPYATKWGIDQFHVISAGDRDSTGNDIVSASGTKMRQFVLAGDTASFYKGTPSCMPVRVKKQLFVNTETGLKKANK